MGEREKILVADDQSFVRDSLAALLEGEDHNIVAQVGSVEEVQKLLESGKEFSVAIVDGNMPNEGDGKAAATFIRNKYPNVKIISLSANPQNWGDVNLSKRNSPNEILKAISSL